MSDTIGAQTPNSEVSRMPRYHHTDGGDAAFLAESYGLTPDPWQRLFLDHFYGRNAKGKQTCSTACLSVPRQQGKTALMAVICLFEMVVMKRKVLWTAHQLRTARSSFFFLVDFFTDPNYPELMALVKEIRRANGQEAIILREGSVQFSARSQGAARGLTADVLLIDEAQHCSNETYAALVPVISAAPSGEPRQLLCGTPPTSKSDSEVWTRLRESAQEKRNRKQMWAEWSVPTGDALMIDTADPEVWALANPALGLRLQPDVVESELAAMDEATFRQERLGIWGLGGGAQSALPLDDWKSCADRDIRLDPGNIDQITLAIDVTPSRDSASIVAAISTADGTPPVIDVIDQRAGDLYWLAPRVAQIVEERDVAAVIVDGYSPAASLITAMEDRGVGVTRIGVGFVTTAAERLLDAVATHQLRHMDQVALTTAVAGAVRRPIGKEGRFSFKRLTGESDISPLIAAMLALSALTEHDADLAPVRYRKKRRKGAGRPYTRKVVVM